MRGYRQRGQGRKRETERGAREGRGARGKEGDSEREQRGKDGNSEREQIDKES